MKLNYYRVCLGFAGFKERHYSKAELDNMWAPVKFGNGYHDNCDGPRPYSIAQPYTRLQLT